MVLTTCALRPVLTTLRGLPLFAMSTFDFSVARLFHTKQHGKIRQQEISY
jgi:hypothetical protein